MQRRTTTLRSRNDHIATVLLQNANGRLINFSEYFVHDTTNQQTYTAAPFFFCWMERSGDDVMFLIADIGKQSLKLTQVSGQDFQQAGTTKELLQTTRLVPPENVEIQ